MAPRNLDPNQIKISCGHFFSFPFSPRAQQSMTACTSTKKDYVFANVGRVALIFEQT